MPVSQWWVVEKEISRLAVPAGWRGWAGSKDACIQGSQSSERLENCICLAPAGVMGGLLPGKTVPKTEPLNAQPQRRPCMLMCGRLDRGTSRVSSCHSIWQFVRDPQRAARSIMVLFTHACIAYRGRCDTRVFCASLYTLTRSRPVPGSNWVALFSARAWRRGAQERPLYSQTPCCASAPIPHRAPLRRR